MEYVVHLSLCEVVEETRADWLVENSIFFSAIHDTLESCFRAQLAEGMNRVVKLDATKTGILRVQ